MSSRHLAIGFVCYLGIISVISMMSGGSDAMNMENSSRLLMN